MESFLKSIGVADDVLQHLDQTELAFQRPAVLWGGFLLLIPVAWFIYNRQRNNLSTVPNKFRIVLSATRVLILAMLIAVLAGPYLKIDHRITKKPIMALLFDTSQSMQLTAGPHATDEDLIKVAQAAGYDTETGEIDPDTRKALNRIGRAELAQTVVRASKESFLKPLEDEYELRVYTFSRDLTPVQFNVDDTQPIAVTTDGGTSSQLGEAILGVFEEAAGQQVAGMLLMSDGQNTGGRSPSQAARTAADAKTPVFVTPLGSSERVQDVSIVDVYTSGLVAVGDTVRVHVTLESQGFDGRPVKIELKDGDEVLDADERVVRDSEQQQVELTFEAKRPGAHYLTVDVPALEEESEDLRANNTDTAFVRISEEKLKVLFLDGLPRWDFRFIKNAIRRDNGLAGRTEETPDIIIETEWRRLSDELRSSALPRIAEELADYHTIIIGDVSPDLLDINFQESLIEAVREKGVGLIVSAGTQAMPHLFDKAFQDLLPVKLKPDAAGIEAPAYKPFGLEVSPAGVIHETMRLYDDPGRNQNVWEKMPNYYWCAAVERPAAAATVLAYNSRVEGRFGKMPLIAFHYAGDGKVMFVGTDSTWLWRQNVGDRFFYKFWGQSIRFVARRDDSAGGKSRIEVRPVRAQPGEEAEIELFAFNSDGAPEESPQRKITLLGPDSHDAVELTADPTMKGRYTGKFTPTKQGVHRLAYQPSGGMEAVEATIRVLVAPEEFRHPNLNRPALELLASTSGGAVIDLSDLGSIPARLKGEKELTQLHREATVWDNWLTLLILIVLYSVDVGLRRLMGLS